MAIFVIHYSLLIMMTKLLIHFTVEKVVPSENSTEIGSGGKSLKVCPEYSWQL